MSQGSRTGAIRTLSGAFEHAARALQSWHKGGLNVTIAWRIAELRADVRYKPAMKGPRDIKGFLIC
jgi:hypothetical protein